ncbi:MAG TPA: hypothetical protein VNF99_19485 [Stellaceae bacterium]|nr:hypothetical protein [Stellaceae bacterium]
MARASRSGLQVQPKEVPVILAMINRGDRRHDAAAWFGLNQGRIADVEEGKYGTPALADDDDLPPSGSPGPKARDIRAAVQEALGLLKQHRTDDAIKRLERAIIRFDKNE